MRLGVGRRVAADDRAGAPAEPERVEQRRRVARRLVGHDAPFERARLDGVEQRVDVREQRRVHAERRLVVREKRVAQRRVLGMLGRDAHAGAEQPARAVRGRRAQRRDRAPDRGRAPRRTRFSAAPRSGAVSASVPSRSNRTASIGSARAAGRGVGPSAMRGAAERHHVVDAGIGDEPERSCVNGL